MRLKTSILSDFLLDIMGSVREYLAEHIQISLPDLTDRLYEELRVNMTEKQKQNYYNRLVRKLAIGIKDGMLTVNLK